MLELETDKATIEVPSSVAGKVTEVKVKAGDKVKMGQVILTVDGEASVTSPQSSVGNKQASVGSQQSSVGGQQPSPAVNRRQPAVLNRLRRKPRRLVLQRSARIPPRKCRRRPGLEQRVEGRGDRPRPTSPARLRGTTSSTSAAARVRAAEQHRPTFRRRLPRRPFGGWRASSASTSIRSTGSGTDGRISIEDVKAHAKRLLTQRRQRSRRRRGIAKPLPDFSRWGEVERQPMRAGPPQNRRAPERGVVDRFRTSRSTTSPTSPALEELRKRYAKQVGSRRRAAHGHCHRRQDLRDRAQAVPAVQLVDRSRGRRDSCSRNTCNIGVAVDTDRGLLVPVIRNADTKSIIADFDGAGGSSPRRRARASSALDEMQGGSFSISQPRRHRRHVLHADRERARGGHSRDLARDAWSRSSTKTAASSRG